MGAAQRLLSLDDWQIRISRHKSIDSCYETVPKGRLRVAQDDSPGYKVKNA